MKKYLSYVVSNTFKVLLFLSVFLSTALVNPNLVQAQPQAWSGGCVDENNPDVATIQGLECLIANVFSVMITLIGFGSFVMLIIASFRWMASGSSTKHVETAINTMRYAIYGIILSLSAFIIINLISEFTGIDQIRNFILPNSDTDLPSGP